MVVSIMAHHRCHTCAKSRSPTPYKAFDVGGEVDQVDTWSERADHARLLRGPDVLWHAPRSRYGDCRCKRV